MSFVPSINFIMHILNSLFRTSITTEQLKAFYNNYNTLLYSTFTTPSYNQLLESVQSDNIKVVCSEVSNEIIITDSAEAHIVVESLPIHKVSFNCAALCAYNLEDLNPTNLFLTPLTDYCGIDTVTIHSIKVSPELKLDITNNNLLDTNQVLFNFNNTFELGTEQATITIDLIPACRVTIDSTNNGSIFYPSSPSMDFDGTGGGPASIGFTQINIAAKTTQLDDILERALFDTINKVEAKDSSNCLCFDQVTIPSVATGIPPTQLISTDDFWSDTLGEELTVQIQSSATQNLTRAFYLNSSIQSTSLYLYPSFQVTDVYSSLTYSSTLLNMDTYLIHNITDGTMYISTDPSGISTSSNLFTATVDNNSDKNYIYSMGYQFDTTKQLDLYLSTCEKIDYNGTYCAEYEFPSIQWCRDFTICDTPKDINIKLNTPLLYGLLTKQSGCMSSLYAKLVLDTDSGLVLSSIVGDINTNVLVEDPKSDSYTLPQILDDQLFTVSIDGTPAANSSALTSQLTLFKNIDLHIESYSSLHDTILEKCEMSSNLLTNSIVLYNTSDTWTGYAPACSDPDCYSSGLYEPYINFADYSTYIVESDMPTFHIDIPIATYITAFEGGDEITYGYDANGMWTSFHKPLWAVNTQSSGGLINIEVFQYNNIYNDTKGTKIISALIHLPSPDKIIFGSSIDTYRISAQQFANFLAGSGSTDVTASSFTMQWYTTYPHDSPSNIDIEQIVRSSGIDILLPEYILSNPKTDGICFSNSAYVEPLNFNFDPKTRKLSISTNPYLTVETYNPYSSTTDQIIIFPTEEATGLDTNSAIYRIKIE